MAEVRAMTGAAVEPTQQLMAAGLDSRGAMELRRALGEPLDSRLMACYSIYVDQEGRVLVDSLIFRTDFGLCYIKD